MTYLLASPEDLINSLHIEAPEEIDIEAIAEYCNATVIYEHLMGCEARLIGHKDRAYITVNNISPRVGQRFSVAHELGHWTQDRGEVITSCAEKSLATQWSRDNKEFWNTEFFANHYAAGLLLPTKIFKPLVEDKSVTFETVQKMSKLFQSPWTVTAIRLVDVTPFPSAVICSVGAEASKDQDEYKFERILWSVKGCKLLSFMPLLDTPGHDSIAYNLLSGGFGTPTHTPPAEVKASEWFYHEAADRYTIYEHSIKLAPNLVLTLLWWKDPEQIARLQQDYEDAWEEHG